MSRRFEYYELTAENAEEWIAEQIIRGLCDKWEIDFAERKAKWDKEPGWPAKFVEMTFVLGGKEWSLGTGAIGLDGDGWNHGFMETVQSDMEEDLKKGGATDIHSYGFID